MSFSASKIFRRVFPFTTKEVFERVAREIVSRFPNLQVIATTLRDVKSACRHDLSAVCFAVEEVFKAVDFADLEVLDRVGSGDAFAAGLIYALSSRKRF